MKADLAESGRWCGSNRWAEGRLFETLGAWVPSTADPTAKLLLDRHSLHHAWRAEQWWDRLPVVADVDRRSLVVAPSAATAEVMDALPGLKTAVGRLTAAYRVVIPRLVGSYLRQRAGLTKASDGSMIRTLDIVAADLVADWREGELVLQSLLGDAAAVRESAGVVERLEILLVSRPTPWG